MKEIIFVTILVVVQVTGQAPGDESPSCPTQSPSNVRVLMDSYNYAVLLGTGGVWTTIDNDGSGVTWATGSGGNCQRTIQVVCEKPLTVNNWVFTQYISKTANTMRSIAIFVNVTARFGTCSPCGKLVGVYTITATNSQAPPQNATVSSSSLVGNITTNLNTLIEAAVSFDLKSNETGFYIGLRDTGTCVAVSRVKVYYYQCPVQQAGLVLFPQTPAPTKSNSPLTVIASCVAGGVNTTSLDVQCNNNGGWNGMPTCVCRLADGYYPDSDMLHCAACGVGQWLDTASVSCQLCPQNSSSASIATSKCPCIPGYYRAPAEGPSIGCTAPPSGPSNLTAVAVTNTSITLSWEKPNFIGRNDYYFVVKYRTGSSLQFNTGSNITSTSDTITYTVSNLNPYTSYEINIIARNGVSDQDISNEYKRTAIIKSITSEGVPSVITDVIAINQYVIWQPPTEKNGIITSYIIKVCRGELCNDLSLGPTTFVYQVQVRDIPSGTAVASVQVSAATVVGRGRWSSMVTLTNTTNCPSLVQQQSIDIRPSSSSTCPSVPSCSVCQPCPSYTPVACPSVSCPQQSISKLIPVATMPCPSTFSCPNSPSSSSPINPRASSCSACPSCTTPLCSPCRSCTPAPSPALTSCKTVTSCSACPSNLPCSQMTSCPSCPRCSTSTASFSTTGPLCSSQSCPSCSSLNSPGSPLISSGCNTTLDLLLLNSSGIQSISAPVLSFPATIGISIGLTCIFTSAITAIIVSLVCMVFNMKKKKEPISAMNCGPAEMDVKI